MDEEAATESCADQLHSELHAATQEGELSNDHGTSDITRSMDEGVATDSCALSAEFQKTSSEIVQLTSEHTLAPRMDEEVATDNCTLSAGFQKTDSELVVVSQGIGTQKPKTGFDKISSGFFSKFETKDWDSKYIA
jgi:hypothetical protein